MSGPIPEWLVTWLAAVTVFIVMFSVGLGIAVEELRWTWQRPGPMGRGLFAVLVAAPALALLVARVLELPRAAEVGIVLMAIAPGAPVALRRSLSAGGHQAFAPSLQISAALLAPVSMPLSVAALEQIYAARAVVGPGEIARQVFFAQLLPLALGMTLRRASAVRAERLDASVKRLGLALLAATVGTVLIDTWEIIADAGLSVLAAMALTAAATLAAGHLLGGPEPAMRTAVALAAAARNGGLALLVTAVNRAPPEVIAAVLAYLVVSVFTIVPYVAWRRWRANVSG